jgi:hypothetical protein
LHSFATFDASLQALARLLVTCLQEPTHTIKCRNSCLFCLLCRIWLSHANSPLVRQQVIDQCVSDVAAGDVDPDGDDDDAAAARADTDITMSAISQEVW